MLLIPDEKVLKPILDKYEKLFESFNARHQSSVLLLTIILYQFQLQNIINSVNIQRAKCKYICCKREQLFTVIVAMSYLVK